MPALPMNTRCTTIPALAYRDAGAAIRWLCENFGFEKKAAFEGPNHTIVHAELSFGNGMVMLGTADKTGDFGKWIVQPDEIGHRETQSVYVITADPDEIYRRAKAGGAKVLREIRDEDYGGRGFSCSDPEGHIWSFGSYDPWKA